jgi:hypothetical protein
MLCSELYALKRVVEVSRMNLHIHGDRTLLHGNDGEIFWHELRWNGFLGGLYAPTPPQTLLG